MGDLNGAKEQYEGALTIAVQGQLEKVMIS